MVDKTLNSTEKEIVIDSIKSGGAMSMFLSIISVIIIQCIGCLLIKVFLEYIHNQVETFTVRVSQKMLELENFHHINADSASALP